ncbi:hypothetical protein P8452_48633 [Trifolium repens]|nr:hypothetical protein P8452_48633 [Trifolium repens]
MYNNVCSSKGLINESTDNNSNSKEWWTWDDDKSFEENILEILEGQFLVPGQPTSEVKEHTQMIDNGGNFELQTYYDCISKDNGSTDVNKHPPLKNKIKKVQHWKKEEHGFLDGLEKYGRGNWKAISKHVGTKTCTQVASHAQKYFIRVDQQNGYSAKKSKRRSKFDTTSWNGDFHPLLYRDCITPSTPNVETHPTVEQMHEVEE